MGTNKNKLTKKEMETHILFTDKMSTKTIKLTADEKQQLQDIFRLYFDTWICDDRKTKTIIKLSKKFKLDNDYINTLVDEVTNYLPF